MNSKMRWRAAAFAVLAAIFFAALLCLQQPREEWDGEYCLGIPLLSKDAVSELGDYRYQDYSEDLKFQNEHAAVDKENATIYISQRIDRNTTAQDLIGELSIGLPGTKLFFVNDGNWNHLSEAVRDGYAFRLLVQSPLHTYMEYDVVFTTLPVLYIYGHQVFTNANNRNVSYGRIVLWDPEKMDENGSGIHSSHLQWHVRGGSSSLFDKNPWKLSLKNGDGKNNNADLLGMGADDDWILNAMNLEDSNLREKLFMDLWNDMAVETDYNYSMSTGEYVEVLVNGEYTGLYLLQRRIDPKYLSLDDQTILMKVNQLEDDTVYEFVSSEYNKDIPYGLMDAFFYEGDSSALDKNNFIDVSLFLNYFSALDNISYKNMFYVFEREENSYRIRMIPWDTDLSMAIFWQHGKGFIYDYEGSLHSNIDRMEMESMEAIHPDLKRELSERWFALRNSVFTTENIWSKLDEYRKILDASGAVRRDQEKWGLFFEGQDTMDNLYRFAEERLQVLDSHYGK